MAGLLFWKKRFIAAWGESSHQIHVYEPLRLVFRAKTDSNRSVMIILLRKMIFIYAPPAILRSGGVAATLVAKCTLHSYPYPFYFYFLFVYDFVFGFDFDFYFVFGFDFDFDFVFVFIFITD